MIDTIHTIPIGDTFEHITGGHPCWCQPEIVTLDNGDRQVIHNSFDGREHSEVDHQWWNCEFCLEDRAL